MPRETTSQCDEKISQCANAEFSDTNKKESFILESFFDEATNCNNNRCKETDNKSSTCQNTKERDKNNDDLSLNLDSDKSIKIDSDNIKTLKSRFIELQEEHKKLIAVTAELTNALQLNIIGQTKNICYVLDQCKIIYPALFVSQFSQNTPHDNINTQQDRNTGMEYQENSHEDYNEKITEHANQEELDNVLNLAADVNHMELDNIDLNGEEHIQQCSPISERDIRDILEVVLSKAMQYFNETENPSERDCCDIGQACSVCQEEISKIVDSVLVKVTETPRFRTTPRSNKNIIESNRSQVQTSNKSTSPKESPVEHSRIEDAFKSVEVSQEFSTSCKNVQEHPKIDYDSLKNDLLKSGVEKKLVILQSLRWGLTKSKAEDTEIILEAYIQNDILDLHEKHPLPELLCVSDSPVLNENVFRLINTIASLRQGRKYLASNSKLLRLVLLPKFMEKYTNTTPTINDMIIATLQKLSLQKHVRIWMLEEGLLEYLIIFLKETYGKLSPYSSERSIALLMNLCSMDKAKEYCISNAKKIVNLIQELLKEEHPSCLPFVNGTMLSLLSHEEVKAEAKKQKLDQLLHQLIKNTKDEYTRRQLVFIVQSRFSDQLQCFIGDDDESSQNCDVLESELDTDSEDEILKVVSEAKQMDSVQKEANQSTHVSTSQNGHNCSTQEDTSVSKINKSTKIPLPIQKDTKKRKIIRKFFPRSSFCYLEICHEALEGTSTCSCTKCVPTQNRYSCGCYDVICREVEEEINKSISKAQGVSKTKYIKKTIRTSSLDGIENSPRAVSGQCPICGDKICDCAFESRPKIHRTPPES